MKPISQERGQALILIVFAAIGIFAFAALAIDGSRVFSDRRHAQNAADTAVLAAALAKVRANPPSTGDTAATQAGVDRAASNGFDASNSIVEVNSCAKPGLNPPCEGLPQGANLNEYIQVVIRFTTKTTFARVIGRYEVPSIVTAVAKAQMSGVTPGGGMAALAGLEPTLPNAVLGDGHFNLNIINSGIFSNSTDPCGFSVKGSGTYEVDTTFGVVSNAYCPSGVGQAITLDQQKVKGAGAITYPPSYNIPAPSINCPGPGSITGDFFSGYTVSPGSHPSNLPNGHVTFAQGDHCFPSGLMVSGNTDITANNVNWLISGGAFTSNTNGSFECSNMIVYINGGTKFDVGGGSDNTCTGITFYAATGTVNWNGNPSINFSAPTSGPYKGLLIYLPITNSSKLTINGNSQQSLTGSIIAAASPVEINGVSGTFALSSQVTGRTIKLGGTGNIEIDFNPDQQYSQSGPTMIQLTK